MNLARFGNYIMPDAYLSCPSCGKTNVSDGSYCIRCGSILNPIYCSQCGTPNPDGLEKCLECGAPMPSLRGFRWTPIVTVLNPTSAMNEKTNTVPYMSTDGEGPLKWLRSKLERD
ncbi:MAG: double zinc ribbon domain-containing protein [Candidatus Bathyarchaeia archaeon]